MACHGPVTRRARLLGPMIRTSWLCVAALVGLLAPARAYSHGADANTADIRLAGDTAYVVVWPPSDAFGPFDDNADGFLQRSETDAHRPELLAYFRERFALEDQSGQAGELVFEDVSTPLSDWNTDEGAMHLRVTLRYRWKQAPDWLVLDYSLFASHPMLVRASRVAPAGSVLEQKLLAPVESTVFGRATPRQALLKGSDTHQPAAASAEAASSHPESASTEP